MKETAVAAVVFLAACNSGSRGPTPSSAPATPRPGSGSPAATPGFAGPLAAAADAVAKTLTDDMLTRFAAYETATLAQTDHAPGAAGTAMRVALRQKSGLTDDQVHGLIKLTGSYYGRLNAQRMMATEAAEREKRVADAEAAGQKPSVMDEMLAKNAPQMRERQAKQLADFKQKFTRQYGDQTAALLDRHWPEFQPYYAALMKKIMRLPAGPRH